MSNTERLINAGQKLAFASVQRMKDLRNKPFTVASDVNGVKAEADDVRLISIAALGITSKDDACYVHCWLTDDRDNTAWTLLDDGFKNGVLLPLDDGAYSTGLSKNHLNLIAGILERVRSNVERGLQRGDPEEPGVSARIALEEDLRVTFVNPGRFSAAWEWVEHVGGS